MTSSKVASAHNSRAGSRVVLLSLLAVAMLLWAQETSAQLYTHVGSFVAVTPPPANGNQDVSWTGGTAFTPQAVIFFWTRQNAIGFANNASVGYGFGTLAGGRAVAYASDHNVARPGNSKRWQSDAATNHCIVFLTGAGTTDGLGRLTSTTSQGFRINWAPKPATGWIIHYLAIGGPDVTNATVGTFTPTASTSVPEDEPIPGVGFQPSFLMFLSIDSNTPNSAVTPHGKIGFGFAGLAGGTILTQGAVTMAARTTGGQVNTNSWQQPGKAILEKNARLAETTFEANVKSFDVDGFTITKTLDTCPAALDPGYGCGDSTDGGPSPAVETDVHYLALEGGAYKVGSVTKPAATGPDNQAEYRVGFQPSGLAFFSDNLIASLTYNQNAAISFSAADDNSPPNQRATFFEDHIDAPISSDNSWVRQGTSGNAASNGRIVFLAQAGDCYPGWPEGAGTDICVSGSTAKVNAEADVASYGPKGFTLNWPTNVTGSVNPTGPLNETAQDGAEVLFVAFGDTYTTAVELSSFTANPLEGAVELSWETGSELRNLGFHLYRSLDESGPYERITASLIPGLGSSAVGASYGYRDSGLVNGVTHYYKLEDVETTGRTELHGPVSATPQAGAVAGGSGSGEGSSSGSEPARISYGEPQAVSLEVVRRSPRGLELDLRTGGFYATPEPDGSVRLEVPGFEVAGEPGAPAIPVERTFIEAVAGRQVRIAAVVPEDVAGFSSLRPALAEAPELVVGRNGTVRAGSRRARAVWHSRGLYPEQAARVVSTAFQGEVKKALVELSPLRWDPASGQLLLARRLRVQLVFAGLEEDEIALGGGRGRRYRERPRPSGGPKVVAHLVARERGLYAVGFESLFGRGRPVSASQLRLARLGEDVAFHIEPDPSRFGPGSVLYFLSEGGALSAYANEAVYELSLGAAGTPMAVVSASTAGAALDYAVEHASWEQNRYYLSGLLEAPDLWLWDSLLSGAHKSYTLALSGLAASSEPATLRVWLQGASDLDGSPDHHVRVSVNGSLVTEASWDGKAPQRLEAQVSPGILHEGENLLELESVADTAAAYSMVYLDRVSLDYPHALAAEAGRFEASFSFPGRATVAGLGAASAVLDTTEAGEGGSPRWISGALASPAGLTLSVEAQHRYLAVSPEALLPPEIRWPSPSDLRSTRNQGDYLLLAPREFLPAATPLLQLREQQGLQTRAVALEEIFDLFGFGERSAEAVHDFLAYAYHRWSAPSPRYVLLLGDATLDPKDYAGTGVEDRVPALMIKSSYLWTVSDQALAAVNGDDDLPDLALGRLPASSLEQARSLVQKLVAFEEAGFDLSGPAVLVADNADRAGDFEKNADEIAASLLASHPAEKIYLSRLGASATRSAILSAFDRGASLMSYVGHGGTSIWASENILNIYDMDKLGAQAQQPLLFTMNCLNGYFLPPVFDSLGEALMKTEGKGAIVAFTPSGLSLDQPAHRYHKALLGQLLSGGHARLGDAILAAQSDYTGAGAFPEILRIYNLLGDPALSLR